MKEFEKMKTIVWDVDDVLNDLMRDWLEQWWYKEHPACKVVYRDISHNPPHEVLGIGLEEYLESLDRFRLAVGATLKPNPEVLSWFQRYGTRFRHAVLTSVPMKAADISAGWVYKYFGNWIRSFNIVPSVREGDTFSRYDQSKKDYLLWWGKADIFIDDNLKNVTDAKEIGIDSILMPAPWNNSDQQRSDILQYLVDMICDYTYF